MSTILVRYILPARPARPARGGRPATEATRARAVVVRLPTGNATRQMQALARIIKMAGGNFEIRHLDNEPLLTKRRAALNRLLAEAAKPPDAEAKRQERLARGRIRYLREHLLKQAWELMPRTRKVKAAAPWWTVGTKAVRP